MVNFDSLSTLIITILVLILGTKLVSNIEFLKKRTIPEPVVGGLLAELILLILRKIIGWEIKFDFSLKDPLMLSFFATIGLNANLINLWSGGKVLGIFLIVVIGLLLIQNAIGIGVSFLLGLNPLIGLLSGSITLSGGHSTGAVWSKLFIEYYNFKNANEVAMACATFGLILGGLIGGPVARYLIKVSNTSNSVISNNTIISTSFKKPEEVDFLIISTTLVETIVLVAICIKIGKIVAQQLVSTMFELPVFICVLLVSIIIKNSLAFIGFHCFFETIASILGNLCSSLFLSMVLIDLKLWELNSLALPIVIILSIQTLFMALYAIFVTWRVMGKNYDAAVLAAGHCGFGLGATPTAIANMQAITDRFGYSNIAFLVVPIVGAFFIDIINTIVIKLYLILPIFHEV